jgi:hypothetical protein
VERSPRPKEMDFRLPIDTLISLIFRTLEPFEGNVMRHMHVVFSLYRHPTDKVN